MFPEGVDSATLAAEGHRTGGVGCYRTFYSSDSNRSTPVTAPLGKVTNILSNISERLHGRKTSGGPCMWPVRGRR